MHALCAYACTVCVHACTARTDALHVCMHCTYGCTARTHALHVRMHCTCMHVCMRCVSLHVYIHVHTYTYICMHARCEPLLSTIVGHFSDWRSSSYLGLLTQGCLLRVTYNRWPRLRLAELVVLVQLNQRLQCLPHLMPC